MSEMKEIPRASSSASTANGRELTEDVEGAAAGRPSAVALSGASPHSIIVGGDRRDFDAVEVPFVHEVESPILLHRLVSVTPCNLNRREILVHSTAESH